jgi:signal peptidase II
LPSADKERPDDSARPAPSRRLAVRSPICVAVFLAVSAAGLTADLLTKHAVFQSLLGRPGLADDVRLAQARLRARHGEGFSSRDVLEECQLRRPVCPGVQLTLSTNPGVVFGINVPRPAVAVATAITMALVFYFFATSDRRAWAVQAALALILAGAMGNLYDRLFSKVELPGIEPIRNQVRDFIDCSGLHYPWVFNVADVLLVVGVALLVVHWWIAGRGVRRKPAGPSGSGRSVGR